MTDSGLTTALDALRGVLQGERPRPLPACERLDAIADTFGLSSFERSLVLLAAAPDLDGSFAKLLPDGRVTLALALEKLAEPHWDALATESALRRWELIKFDPGGSITHSAIRVDETVLMALLGVRSIDEHLLSVLELVEGSGSMVPTHLALAKAVAECWHSGHAVNLVGPDTEVKRDVFAYAAVEVGLQAWSVQAASLPQDVTARFEIVRKWTRQVALHGGALLICADDDSSNAAQFCRLLMTPCAIGTLDRVADFTGVNFEVNPPDKQESATLWRAALGDRYAELNGSIEALVEQFVIPVSDIPGLVRTSESSEEPFEQALWDAARKAGRRKLDDLAQRLQSKGTWDDIVLPNGTMAILKEIVSNVRNRSTVFGKWGFGEQTSRGLGIAALFHGPSGTGKTLAAEVLAGELGLDLFRIDLSSIVSKYIGETEKNLRRIFDAAERCGAILLFDEADALFGKRTEVKDSHDRYANIEVSYLLQRMETYRGIAILTTNMKEAFDPAFLRRIRFVVEFPFPAKSEREKIWMKCVPNEAPLNEVSFGGLSRLSVPGGNIRNIALSAAFLACEERCDIEMRHFLAAAKSEYAKIDRPLTDSEVAGWL